MQFVRTEVEYPHASGPRRFMSFHGMAGSTVQAASLQFFGSYPSPIYSPIHMQDPVPMDMILTPMQIW